MASVSVAQVRSVRKVSHTRIITAANWQLAVNYFCHPTIGYAKSHPVGIDVFPFSVKKYHQSQSNLEGQCSLLMVATSQISAHS